MIQSSSASHAKAYFSDALLKSDYYINDQELQGKYHGRLAERLGLNQSATKESFFALCENINPKTGKPLTPRSKEDRTIGYDINFHCPKSVSIIHALSKDTHLLEAFQDSVSETMRDIEADTKTRVRKSGRYDDRETGELIWADFVHQTARPVDDHTPDPHLHSHCFVFNATWDDQEKQFKAAKFKDIKMDMPYYQARFHKRLSDKMLALGYQVKLTDKSFEIEGVPQNVIDLFSKRTDEISRAAKEKGITDAKELDKLGARTRSKKQKGLSMAELKTAWRQQIHALGEDKDTGDKAIRFAPAIDLEKSSPKLCIDHALKHSFERASVMRDRRILGTAYRFALGNNRISVDDVTRQFLQDDRLIQVQEGGRTLCTTKEVLKEEKRMVELARQGQGKLTPLYKKAPALTLNNQQADAVSHILTTANRVSIIRGAAGTGKTTLMRKAVDLMEKAGKKVMVVAPTAQASRGVLKEEGFHQAETVAKLLMDEKLQKELQDQVLWVDEAGLLGTKDMTELLALATRRNARLILGGDTRQHASVIRGDALRILNTVGGIKTAEVSKIYRQKDARYRDAVQDLSKGDVGLAFEKLDGMGSIKTVDPLKPNEELVNDYINAVKKGKTALVISPTHKQGEEVTQEIRRKLRQAGKIGKKEITAKKLTSLNMTEAEKADWRNFAEGQIIQFNQNVRGIKRGSAWSVKSITDKEVLLLNEKGQSVTLPKDKASHYDVYRKTEIALSKGDKVQITRNGFDEQEKRLNNGLALEVVSVTKKGKITLRNKLSKATYVLDKEFGHISHAHSITSHASQGKTVDEVFIAQPSATFPATDARQFYVSVSRARDSARIYTDDKIALLGYASELGDRQSALELVTRKKSHINHVHNLDRQEHVSVRKPVKEKANLSINKHHIEMDYEPEF